MAPDERRNDVGYKATFTMLMSVVSILLGLFIHAAWSTASDGNDRSCRNEVKIATIEECVRNLKDSLSKLERNTEDIKYILEKKYTP